MKLPQTGGTLKRQRRPKPGENRSGVPPTGIMRTLPYFGANMGALKEGDGKKAYRRMMFALNRLKDNPEAVVYIAFPARPTQEVLDCYLVVGGEVRCRARIADWIEGDKIGEVNCWDGSTRDAKWWAVLTGPVSFPPVTILQRGFRGFRYCTDLW